MLVGGLFVDVESQVYPRYIFAVFVSKRHIFQLNRCAERDPLFKLMDFKKKIKKIDSQNQKLEKLRDGIRKIFEIENFRKFFDLKIFIFHTFLNENFRFF